MGHWTSDNNESPIHTICRGGNEEMVGDGGAAVSKQCLRVVHEYWVTTHYTTQDTTVLHTVHQEFFCLSL
jgi:hypothetical protein